MEVEITIGGEVRLGDSLIIDTLDEVTD